MAGHSPIKKQEQGQDRQVSGGDICLLLEADKDDDDKGCRDNVVALKKETEMSPNLNTFSFLQMAAL